VQPTQVTTIQVPQGVLWSDVTSYIMMKYNLEISGGLGPTAGKARSSPHTFQGIWWRHRCCASLAWGASSPACLHPRRRCQVWRVGLMGHNARPGNVVLVLAALADALSWVGWLKPAGNITHDLKTEL